MPSSFKPVTSGQAVADAAVLTQTLRGNSLKPLAPANVRATRNANGDILIQWSRRARIGAGMRPFTDMPLAEERADYQIEIYNGSTLIRTLYLNGDTDRAEPVLWDYMHFTSDATPTISADGSLQFGVSNDTVRSLQVMYGDFVLDVGANASNTKLPGFSVVTLPDRTVYAAYERDLGDPNSAFALVGPTFGTSTADGTYPNRLQIARVGSTLSFFQVSGAQRHLLNTSPNGTTEPLVMLSFSENGESEFVNKPVLTYAAPSIMYYANQQSEDFGSVQTVGTLKVIVYEVSAIVGRGFPREAML